MPHKLTSCLEANDVTTPCFVLCEKALQANAKRINEACRVGGSRFLYSMKPLAIHSMLKAVASYVDGFSVSSYSDATLASQVKGKIISLVAPVIIPGEVDAIARICDTVVCNSLNQLELLARCSVRPNKTGLRVNPKLSFLSDSRYDPCAIGSRLGVPIDQLTELQNDWEFDCLNGLHFHTNCDSNDFAQLLETSQKIVEQLGPMLDRCTWINLGGGYLFQEGADTKCFEEAVALFRARGLEVFIEPGAALVRAAGTLVSTVLDIVKNDGKSIAILDTTVNHMPEVFEYQFEPDVLNTVEDGKFSYVLAGRSCLAGDIFGEYAFETPINIGDSIVFPNAGAYTVPKWNQFNGIPFPTVYLKTTSGELKAL